MSDLKIRNETAIQNLLNRIPKHVGDSFSDEQLISLEVALRAHRWGKHKIDFRGTLPLPFFKSKIYYVFLMGRNHRSLSRQERLISEFTFALVITLLMTFSVLMGLLVLYLVKSALGINLIEGFSFGIWDWFKGLWK